MQAYVINLDRSPDRLAFFQQQAAAAAISVERISAVDGRQLSEAELQDAVLPQFEFQPINECEIGLFMSHKRAWQKLVDSGACAAAVFEDDAVIAPEMGEILQAIDDRQPSFDVIKLESTLRKVVCERESLQLTDNSTLQRLLTWHGGTAGYVISADCAQRLLKLREKLADPVDQVMFNPMSKVCAELNIFQLTPAACIQNDILARHQQTDTDAFGTTIDRNVTRRRLFRHGVIIDIRRLLKKQQERRRRIKLARHPTNIEQAIPFAQPAKKRLAS